MAKKTKRADSEHESDNDPQLFYDPEHLQQVDLETLKQAFLDGYDLAVDQCVLKCYLEAIDFPEWVKDCLMIRSQNNLNLHAQESWKKQRYDSIVFAAIKAIDDLNLVRKRVDCFRIAKTLFSISNFRTISNWEYTVENIKTVWNRDIKKHTEPMFSETVYQILRNRLEQIPENISVQQIKEVIKKMEPIYIPF